VLQVRTKQSSISTQILTISTSISQSKQGAHSNPAFSLLFALRGILPWAKLPVYWIAQYLGAFCGAAAVLGVYWGAIFSVLCQRNVFILFSFKLLF
jgi:glycerol uptake facilitator-like aquaporin